MQQLSSLYGKSRMASVSWREINSYYRDLWQTSTRTSCFNKRTKHLESVWVFLSYSCYEPSWSVGWARNDITYTCCWELSIYNYLWRGGKLRQTRGWSGNIWLWLDSIPRCYDTHQISKVKLEPLTAVISNIWTACSRCPFSSTAFENPYSTTLIHGTDKSRVLITSFIISWWFVKQIQHAF